MFFSTRTVFFSFLTSILLVRRALSARASEQGDFGAVSGGNRATTGASGRCRGATTDSSESGARVRPRAELVAPQFSSRLSSSCRQERNAARQCGFLLVVPFSFVIIILLVRRASPARRADVFEKHAKTHTIVFCKLNKSLVQKKRSSLCSP